MELSSDFNKFLSTQLKIQKAREGFEAKMISPIEFNSIIYLNYDLEKFIVKPIGVYPAFDSIMIPILSITTMNTTEPTTLGNSNPAVHLRLTIPPFSISLEFPSDCRSFGTFIETIEFLILTLNPNHLNQSQKEIFDLRKNNEQLQSTIHAFHSTKIQQEQVIQELSKLLNNSIFDSD